MNLPHAVWNERRTTVGRTAGRQPDDLWVSVRTDPKWALSSWKFHARERCGGGHSPGEGARFTACQRFLIEGGTQHARGDASRNVPDRGVLLSTDGVN
jgi:hypothetical protein